MDLQFDGGGYIVHVIIGVYTNGEVAAIGAFTDKTHAMNIRDKLLDTIFPGDGIVDYRLDTCNLKEPQ